MGDIKKPDKKKYKVLDTQESHVASSEEEKKAYTMDTYRNLTKKKKEQKQMNSQ